MNLSNLDETQEPQKDYNLSGVTKLAMTVPPDIENQHKIKQAEAEVNKARIKRGVYKDALNFNLSGVQELSNQTPSTSDSEDGYNLNGVTSLSAGTLNQKQT